MRCAAASSTFSPRRPTRPCASSFSAMRSNRCEPFRSNRNAAAASIDARDRALGRSGYPTRRLFERDHFRLSPRRRDGRSRRTGHDRGRRQALDEERARERHTLLADEDAGEALRAELSATPISLNDLGALVAAHATLVFPGAIEMGEHGPDWAPPAIESFVFECRPVEHFNRQIGLFTEAMREWIASGENVFIVSAAVSRTIDLLHAARNRRRRASARKRPRRSRLDRIRLLDAGPAAARAGRSRDLRRAAQAR